MPFPPQPPVAGPPVPAGGAPGTVIGGGLGLVPAIGGANGLGGAAGMNPGGYSVGNACGTLERPLGGRQCRYAEGCRPVR